MHFICFDFIDYTLITSNGTCVHKETGDYPTFCLDEGFSRSECQVECTNHNSCIAYVYDFDSYDCRLVVSDGRCPNLYRFVNGTTAKSKDDLIAHPKPGYACYARNLGKKHTD